MNILYKMGVILTLSISFTSCNRYDKLLDTTSSSDLSSSDIFKTPDRILGLVNGVYKSLKTGSGRLFLNTDVRGEEFINMTNNAFSGFDGWANNYSASSADVATIWEQAYATINNANILIEGLNGVQNVITEDLKKQYIAEGRFIRALSYFNLVTLYSRPYIEGNGAAKALPLRLKAELSVANINLERSTVAQVYNQIIEDLNFAETNLPVNYSTSELNTTRAHKNTAIALKTRVYLNQHKFGQVIIEAKKIVAQTQAPFSATVGVQHALQTNITTIFSSNYTTTESIFSFPVTSADPPSSPLGASYNVNADFSLNANGIWGDAQVSSADARKTLSRVVSASNTYFLTKYAKTSPYLDYVPVIRYAEVLLNYAEAAAYENDLSLAVKLLEAVHKRSDAAFIFPPSSIDTKDNIIKTVWKERRIELLGEGFRSNDLLRNQLSIPAKQSSSFQARIVNPTDAGYIFPYPNSEILSNKSLLN